MVDEYLIGDKAWAAIEDLLPKVYAGARRKDDRRIMSGSAHVLRSGCWWNDCPAVYGPSTTVYNRFNRWSRRGRWQGIFDALVKTVRNDTRSIDGTSIKVQRSAAGGEGSASKQKIGRLHDGRTTKIHAIADSQGRLFRFSLTAGNIADITAGCSATIWMRVVLPRPALLPNGSSIASPECSRRAAGLSISVQPVMPEIQHMRPT